MNIINNIANIIFELRHFVEVIVFVGFEKYSLFIIDKYAGAKHIIDEMKIVK